MYVCMYVCMFYGRPTRNVHLWLSATSWALEARLVFVALKQMRIWCINFTSRCVSREVIPRLTWNFSHNARLRMLTSKSVSSAVTTCVIFSTACSKQYNLRHLTQGFTNTERHLLLCTLAHNTCGSSAQKVPSVTKLASAILKWLLDFWKSFASMIWTLCISQHVVVSTRHL